MNRRNIFLAILAMVGGGVSQIDAVQRLLDAGEVVPAQKSRGPNGRSPESLREGLVAVVVDNDINNDSSDKADGIAAITEAMCTNAIGPECTAAWAGSLAMKICRTSDDVEVAAGDLWQVTPDQYVELNAALTPRNKYVFLRKTSSKALREKLLTLSPPLKICETVIP